MLSVAILEIVNEKTLNVFTHFVSLKSRSELELNNDKFYLEHRILTEHTIPSFKTLCKLIIDLYPNGDC